MMSKPIWVALAIDVVLVGLHVANELAVPMGAPALYVDLGVENNLPTWWSAVQLWTAALLLGIFADRQSPGFWAWAAAALLAFLSLDEMTSLHERVAEMTRSEVLPVTGIWPLVLGPLLLIAVIAIAVGGRSCWERDRTGAILLGTGLVGLVFFAAGLEMVANVVEPGSAAQFMEILLEEAGELVSGTVILAGAYRFARLPNRGAVNPP